LLFRYQEDATVKTPLALVSILILLTLANAAVGQYPKATDPAKPDGAAVQHGAQPNPNEVRPGNRDGDSPSASAGDIVREQERRVLGLPVNAALVIAGALVVIAIIGAAAMPRSARRRQARGNGSYGTR
jgi:hypothetical protein